MRKQDATKRLRTAKKVALTMAALAKSKNGVLEIGYRALAREAGVSKHALQRSLEILVADQCPSGSEGSEDFDPVFFNMDRRKLRHGGLFVCLCRGSYPLYDKSLYRLNEPMLNELGWAP